ncbi:hypothetical protein QTN25_002464 [Entamoeba marina]
MMFCLEARKNGKDKKIFFFEIDKSKEGIIIGRNEENDVILDGDMVSNFHCIVKLVDYDDLNAHIEVENKSTNGTYVTGTNDTEMQINEKN